MYTETIERIQRFKLALRMGIPIFFLAGVLLFSLLTQYFDHIPTNFIIIIVGLLAVSVYFQFYLIYQGFNERITDNVTHTFTSEYLKKLFDKRKKKEIQTLILYSIDNISDINERLGIKNGDRVLHSVSKIIDQFFKSRGVKKLIISHYKGGNFIILLDGYQSENRLLFDLFSTKVDNSKIDDIEIKTSAAVIDTNISDNFEKLLDRLFELKIDAQKNHQIVENDKLNLNKLENSIIEAIKNRQLSIMGQKVDYTDDKIIDISVKLIDENGKFIHQKRFLPIISRLGLRAEYELTKIKLIIKESEKNSFTYYAVNVAAEVLRDSYFKKEIKEIFSDIKNYKFIIIIEEKEYFSNIRYFDHILQEYRDLGIKIALDGLGNNHTIQLYMKDLHVDMIRFDSSYGKNIKDRRYQNIIEGLNLTAQKMNLVTWIRLIGDEKSAKIAKDIGIDIISGNYFSKIENLKKEEI